MSDQLSKPLVGQFKFLNNSDRSATCNNLRIQGGASHTGTVASNATTLDCSTGSLFSVTHNANITITLSNLVDGQIVNVVLVNSNSGSAITPTFATATGTLTTLAASATGLYTLYKVGSALYVKGDDL